jgi:hypothetical protein
LAVTPKDEKTGGDKPRPYGFGGIPVASVGAGFTPARHFQRKKKNDHALTDLPTNRYWRLAAHSSEV